MDKPAVDASTPQALTVTQAHARLTSLLSLQEDGGEAEPSNTPAEAEAGDQVAEEETPTGDEQEAEAEATDEADEEAQDEEEVPPTPRTHKLKVDGEEIEVTEDELLRGYSRKQESDSYGF